MDAHYLVHVNSTFTKSMKTWRNASIP